MSDFSTIRYAVDDGIATITLDRPETLNAIGQAMIGDLIAALDRADADDAVRAVILTGAGRAFCAGADLSRGSGSFAAAGDGPEPGGVLALRMFRSTKPLIGAINGAAAGLGATMTLPLDLRVAADTARFGFVFARRGMVPEAASSFFLPRLVGIARALDWCMSGRLVGADEALAAGLVGAVHAAEALPAAARAAAHALAGAGAPVSIALTRRMLWQGLTLPHPRDAHRIESRAIAARARSADAREGAAAFVEKRVPAFPQTVPGGLPEDYATWFDENEETA